MVHEFFKSFAVCPRCQTTLTSKSGQLSCGSCHQRFPNISGVPWLVDYPQESLADWRQRIDFHFKGLNFEEAHARGYAFRTQSAAGKRRFESLTEGSRHNHQVLTEILREVTPAKGLDREMHRAVRSQLPLSLKLMGYGANLHRDWAWGETENQLACARLLKLRPKGWGRVLVLGAGAGRLAYDLALETDAEVVVALDLNPALVLMGKAIAEGKVIPYYEFPLAPLGADHVAVKADLKAPRGRAEKLLWLFADGLQAPFLPGTFSTIVTPWFIDVVPERVRPLGQRLQRMLVPEGVWLNFGPFGFLTAPTLYQFSLEELKEEMAAAGFSITEFGTEKIPYLQSPHSAQSRFEVVVLSAAKKVGEAPAPDPFRQYPEWLLNHDLAIPKQSQLENYARATQIQFQIVGAVDGTHSVTQIAAAFAAHHGLDLEDAKSAVVSLLRGFWDEHRSFT